MNLRPDALKHLEQAAVLHDIGKIGIDVDLLHKEGALSGNEVEILQQHPLIGVRILQPIGFLQGAREIIEQHHERFDGKGYPYGRSGEELLLEARILAVADAYDAMTSDRPYRQSLPHAIALKEIQDHAGEQFDPQVTEAFLSLWEDEAPTQKAAV
jgi:HD-GYP domain-containing protein (c-di-GMP phosphodiesterase class II)